LRYCSVLWNLRYCSVLWTLRYCSVPLAHEILFRSLGKMFQNASSLKPLGQLKPNCPGMIIGRSSTNLRFFMVSRSKGTEQYLKVQGTEQYLKVQGD
jgi:hypothetical protein